MALFYDLEMLTREEISLRPAAVKVVSVNDLEVN